MWVIISVLWRCISFFRRGDVLFVVDIYYWYRVINLKFGLVNEVEGYRFGMDWSELEWIEFFYIG